MCGDASLSLKKDGTVTIQGPKSVSATAPSRNSSWPLLGQSWAGDNATVSGQDHDQVSGDMVR